MLGSKRPEKGLPMSYNDFAIRISNLSKCYQIYEAPRDRLKQFVMPRVRRIAGKAHKQYFREFWALKDVSFEIKKGETIGIIGRNGSGKSTLLQMICGTLTPTNGSIQTNGRIAALLELGSGFNPEFTGRENVYMNASVLGLSNAQIDESFEDIAAFADIGDFIEQPVKFYSSGMMVRLAFAVIAHVNADILVVDEALAVGDAVFTQKCMRYIRSFQEHGALLFVSHDMSAIQNLCKTALWLDHGKMQQTGISKNVAEAYLQYTLQEVYGSKVKLSAASSDSVIRQENELETNYPPSYAVDYGSKLKVTDNSLSATGWKTGSAEILSLSLLKLDSDSDDIFEGGEMVSVVIHAKAFLELKSPILGFVLRDRLGQDMFGENTLPFTSTKPCPVKSGQEFKAEFIFRLPMLPNGQYVIMTSVADGNQYDNVQHHYLHDAFVVNVFSSKVRFGLVGIPFEQINFEVCND